MLKEWKLIDIMHFRQYPASYNGDVPNISNMDKHWVVIQIRESSWKEGGFEGGHLENVSWTVENRLDPPSGVTFQCPPGVTFERPPGVTSEPPQAVTSEPSSGVTLEPISGVTLELPPGVTFEPPSRVTFEPHSWVTLEPPPCRGPQIWCWWCLNAGQIQISWTNHGEITYK